MTFSGTNSDAETVALRLLQNVRKSKLNSQTQAQTGQRVLNDISSILADLKELEALVTPPQAWNYQVATAYQRSTGLCLLMDWNIPELLSRGGGIMSLDKLSSVAGLSKLLLRGIMREAVLWQIVDEPAREEYRLNVRSEQLLNKGHAARVHHYCDVGFRANAYLPEYLARTKGQQQDDPGPAAFQMAFQTEKPFYESLSCDKIRGARFNTYLEARSFDDSNPIERFFPFEDLKSGALMVDVGGGKGQVCMRVARQNPNLSFIVQDHVVKRPEVAVAQDQALLSRIEWQQHDFFNEQPVKGADVYLMKAVIMDQSIPNARKMIQNIADAMEPNKSVLLIDDALDPGSDGQLSAGGNFMNTQMLSCFGARWKLMEEWESVVHGACSRLEIVDRRTVSREAGWRVFFRLRKRS